MHLPPEAIEERDSIIRQIHEAFDGVVRGPNAISWNETIAMEEWESDDALAVARLSDKDKRWTELLKDEEWNPFTSWGGFSFINAEGFHYYVAPTMIKLLREETDELYDGHLLQVLTRFVGQDETQPWTKAQYACVARVISYMSRYDREVRQYPEDPNVWINALNAGWSEYLPK